MNYSTMMKYKQIGENHFRSESFAEAEHSLILALREAENSSSPNAYVVQRLKSIAVFYSSMGDFALAESYFKRALGMERSLLGRENLGIAKSLNQLAILYLLQSDWEQAESTLKQALSIEEKAPFFKHPEADSKLHCATHHLLAFLYCKNEQEEKGKTLCRKNADNIMNNMGPGGRDLSFELYAVAVRHCLQENHSDAQTICEQVVWLAAEQLQKECLGFSLRGFFCPRSEKSLQGTVVPRFEWGSGAGYEEEWRPSTARRIEQGIINHLDRRPTDQDLNNDTLDKFNSGEEFWRPTRALVGGRN